MIVGLECHGLGEVALGDGADDARRLAGGLDEAGDQRVHVRDRVRPCSGDRAHRRALRDLSVLSDGQAQALELRGQPLVHLDHLVEGIRDLARDARPMVGQPHREVALAYGLEGAQESRQVDAGRGGGLCDTSHQMLLLIAEALGSEPQHGLPAHCATSMADRDFLRRKSGDRLGRLEGQDGCHAKEGTGFAKLLF
jgi:hypothetical protein